jgi:hypothetical protein
MLTPSAPTYALDHFVELISYYPQRYKSDGISLILHVLRQSSLSRDISKNTAVGVVSFCHLIGVYIYGSVLVPRACNRD